MSIWYVYIIRSSKDKLYTGVTTSPVRRFSEHAMDSNKGAKFFRSDAPEEIVFLQKMTSRSEAQKLECKIKKFSRKQKDKFIEQEESLSLDLL